MNAILSTDDGATAAAPGRARVRRRSYVAAGFAFAALEVGCIAVQGGASPSRRDSASSIAAFFRAHAGNIRVSEILAAYGVGALLWWFGGLREVLASTTERGSGLVAVAGAGLAVAVSLVLVDISLFGTAGVASGVLDDASLALLFHASTAAVLVSGVGTAAFLTATCIVSTRAGLFPVWTNYLGFTVAAASAVGALGVGATADVLLVSGYLASLGLCVWMVAVSVSMWRAR